MLNAVRTARNLNNCTVIISQPLAPCVTHCLGQYRNAAGQMVTEFNPGQTCDTWVGGFAHANHCTVFVQVPKFGGGTRIIPYH